MKKFCFPKFPRIALFSSCLFIAACALPRAEPELKLAIPNDEIQAISLMREGLVFYSKNRFVDAEIKFLQADQLLPDSPVILENLAAALKSQGDYAEAKEIIQQLLEKHASTAAQKSNYQLSLAGIAADQGDYNAARSLWLEVLKRELAAGKFDTANKLLQNLAASAFTTGQEDQALCYYFEKAQLISDPNQKIQLARIYIATGYYNQALLLLDEILKNNPNFNAPEFWYYSALAHFALEDFSQATDSWYYAAAFIDQRPDLKLKIELLNNALNEVFPESIEASKKLKINLPKKEEESNSEIEQDVLLKQQIKSYESLLYSTDSLYVPSNLLAVLQRQHDQILLKNSELLAE